MTVSNLTSTFVKQRRLNIVLHGGAWWSCICVATAISQVSQSSLVPRKLDWLGYHIMLKKIWRYVKPLWYNTGAWQMDRQTDWRTEFLSVSRVSCADARWSKKRGSRTWSHDRGKSISCWVFFCCFSLIDVAGNRILDRASCRHVAGQRSRASRRSDRPLWCVGNGRESDLLVTM